MTNIEIKKTPEGKLLARRLDSRPLTDDDRKQAWRLADGLPGITVNDVLRVFGGGRVLTPEETRALMTVQGLPQ